MGYRALPVSDLPAVDFPTISGQRQPAGRQPRDDGGRRRDAAREAVLADRRHHVDQLDATARGSTTITLQFDLDRDIDAAAQDVQVAISRTTRQLPPDMPAPPSFQKVNPADSPDPVPDAELADAAALAGQRVRRRSTSRSASRW